MRLVVLFIIFVVIAVIAATLLAGYVLLQPVIHAMGGRPFAALGGASNLTESLTELLADTKKIFEERLRFAASMTEGRKNPYPNFISERFDIGISSDHAPVLEWTPVTDDIQARINLGDPILDVIIPWDQIGSSVVMTSGNKTSSARMWAISRCVLNILQHADLGKLESIVVPNEIWSWKLKEDTEAIYERITDALHTDSIYYRNLTFSQELVDNITLTRGLALARCKEVFLTESGRTDLFEARRKLWPLLFLPAKELRSVCRSAHRYLSLYMKFHYARTKTILAGISRERAWNKIMDIYGTPVPIIDIDNASQMDSAYLQSGVVSQFLIRLNKSTESEYLTTLLDEIESAAFDKYRQFQSSVKLPTHIVPNKLPSFMTIYPQDCLDEQRHPSLKTGSAVIDMMYWTYDSNPTLLKYVSDPFDRIIRGILYIVHLESWVKSRGRMSTQCSSDSPSMQVIQDHLIQNKINAVSPRELAQKANQIIINDRKMKFEDPSTAQDYHLLIPNASNWDMTENHHQFPEKILYLLHQYPFLASRWAEFTAKSGSPIVNFLQTRVHAAHLDQLVQHLKTKELGILLSLSGKIFLEQLYLPYNPTSEYIGEDNISAFPFVNLWKVDYFRQSIITKLATGPPPQLPVAQINDPPANLAPTPQTLSLSDVAPRQPPVQTASSTQPASFPIVIDPPVFQPSPVKFQNVDDKINPVPLPSDDQVEQEPGDGYKFDVETPDNNPRTPDESHDSSDEELQPLDESHDSSDEANNPPEKPEQFQRPKLPHSKYIGVDPARIRAAENDAYYLEDFDGEPIIMPDTVGRRINPEDKIIAARTTDLMASRLGSTSTTQEGRRADVAAHLGVPPADLYRKTPDWIQQAKKERLISAADF